MKFTAIIIDDEKMAGTLLAGMVKEYCTDIEIVDTYKDLPTGVLAIKKLKPNLVFLDIEMPLHSGLELLDFFEDSEVNFAIIFTTAYNKYAIQAFKLSAVDYLLKPIDPEELELAIERFKKTQHKKDYQLLKDNLDRKVAQKIAINTLNSVKFVELNQILFFKAEGAYTDVTLLSGKIYTVSRGLKSFEEVLKDDPMFLRCHKSYLVNLKYVSEHIKSNGGSLMVLDKYELALSSEKVTEFYSLINAMNK